MANLLSQTNSVTPTESNVIYQTSLDFLYCSSFIDDYRLSRRIFPNSFNTIGIHGNNGILCCSIVTPIL